LQLAADKQAALHKQAARRENNGLPLVARRQLAQLAGQQLRSGCLCARMLFWLFAACCLLLPVACGLWAAS